MIPTIDHHLSLFNESCFLSPLSVLSVLNTSSLLCDCHMQWLGPWLIDNQFQESVSAVCAHPTSLLGRSVQSINLEEFVCGLSPFFIIAIYIVPAHCATVFGS